MFHNMLMLIGVVTALSSSSSLNPSRPTATIDSGPIIGTTTSFPSSTATVRKFLGVPYSNDVTRFEPPVSTKKWTDPYDATTWGLACHQQLNAATKTLYNAIGLGNSLGGVGEDCLNLNVFTPASATPRSLAVLVWFYGGNLQNGAASLLIYDGSHFAAMQDVVVVTVNYRTNVFGFPGGDVPPEKRNLGLLDQRLALEWVQRNIGALGGDPSKVTIFGESAGAASVDALLTAPMDPLPFRAAIMESGQSSVKINSESGREIFTSSWEQLLTATNCTQNPLPCLRAFPADRLQNIVTANNILEGPVSDYGQTWATSPRYERITSTRSNSAMARAPIMIGSNGDEAKPFVIGVNDTRAFLDENGLGLFADEIIAAYPLGAPGMHTENDRAQLIETEYVIQCPIATLANDSSTVDIPTWRYFFNASFPNNELFPGSGAYHSSEIPFVFGTYGSENATDFEKEVSQAMQKAWADFAKDPYSGPGWNAVPAIGIFGDGVKAGMSAKGKKPLRAVSSDVIDSRCNLYEGLYNANLLATYYG